MEISCLKNCLDQYFIVSGENSCCSFPTPNTEDREGAEQTKQDNKMMMFRKGLSRTFPFSAHALPAFRLSRKLLLDVDGVSDCAAGSDSAVLRTTAHATAHARRPTNTSLERRASDESENRLGSHSTLQATTGASPRAACRAARAVHLHFLIHSCLFSFSKKSVQKLCSSSFTEVWMVTAFSTAADSRSRMAG